ncbi:Cna B-type domain-containing protein [Listeria sp. FSL L7-0091]|uniref:Cna B-type domain-containing protein n=1 Tax=Listeria farberi TaxID=2713500 RepID=UPI00162814C1|nr:Cna B-type domain-containing protein [Listeria farberi]MBC2260487.1 Cna B-type domain-containing protein [Listeria farberi]
MLKYNWQKLFVAIVAIALVFQLVPWANIFADANGNNQETVSTKENKEKIDTTVQNNQLLKSGTNWTFSNKVTDVNGNTKAEYQPGDTIKLAVSIAIPSYSESVLNDTYTFWIQKSFFQGDKATFVNPVIDGMTPKQYIFTEDSIKNPTGSKIIDGIEYVGYTLQFNKNPEVLEKYANEPLTNAKFDMFFTLSSTISQKDVYTPIIIEDNSDIKISEIEIPVTPITPDDKDGVMRTVKKLESAWRIDSNTGNYIKIADNPENYVPQNGDLVYFNIYTNNYSGKTAVVSKMTDELPSGYAILEEDSTEWQALIKASGSQLQRGWKLSDDQTNLAPGAKRYDFPYDPAKEFAPNGGENRGLAAKVVDVTKDLTNIAKVPSAGGEGSTGSVTPSGEDIYDMALKTKITETYDKNNKFVGKVASDVTPVSISEGATVSINYTAVNQGNYTKNNVIYAYIPAGFELNNETDTFKTANQKWKYEKTVSKDKGNGVWSDIKVYSYTLPSGIESGGNKSTLLYAKAQGMPDDGSYESTDFYIAGEIGSFSNFNGDTTLDGSITDVDSTPDMNPGNDLLSNVDGTVKPIDNFEKEKAHVINQNAKSTTVLQDEDDFDYDYVSFIEPPVVIPTNGKILEKKRLSAAKAQETARNLLGVDIVGKELKDYVPLADDGVITSPKTYMVYEMDINPDGIKDTLNSTITDTLPKGLKMLEYDINSLNSSNKHIYGFTMNKYEGTPKYTNADGDDVIVYEDGLYSSKQVCIANSTLNDIGVRYFGNNAEKMGVTGSVTNDARTLTLNFGQPSTDPFYNETKAAYKVYMIVIIDPNEIDYSSIMQNKATYTYNEKEIVSYENSEMSWAAGGGTAYAKKYVLDDKTNNYLGGSQYSIATPDANGNLSVDYKVRVRSAYEFDKAAININDKIPASNFKSISNVSINGFEATANTGFLQNGELESPKALDISDYALDASVNGDELTITNPIDIPQMQLYNVLFKVNYKDVKFGTKLVNRAAGSEVNTVVPLKLNILKQDDISKVALTGYEFKTYYTDENGKADLTKPVKDINGNEITITDTTGAASFIPDGYKTSAANQEWQIALVETKTPTGYESNENKEFPLTVKSDEAGNLSISTINEPNYKINNDVNGSTTAVIDNRADVKMIDVNGEKTWTGDKESDRPDSIEVQLLQDGVAYGSSVTVTKADDWKYEFKNVPETNANGDKYTYTVLENTVTNYTSTVTGLDINNTLIKPDIKMINLDGQKTWKNDTENDRPASIEIQLQQNGQDYGFPVTVTKANNWKYEFKNLPETTNDGVAYTYTVVEKAVSGYETKVDGMNIINTKIDTPKTSVSGEKTWENDTVKDRPNYIEVQLLQNGQAYGDLVKVTKENDWKYSFKDLPKADATNKDYRYSVAEIAVPGYKTTTDGMNLTNTKVTDDKNVTTASGTKTWVGDNAKTRPNSIEVQLLQDGKAYGTPIKVTKEMKWKYSFTNLPEKDATGKKYNYTVSEKQVAGYSAKVKGMDLTNTKTTTITPKNTDSTNKIIKPSKTKKLPGTGDANGMLLFVSGVALLFLGLYLKRKSVK